MLCYILMQLADAFEVEATKPSTEVIVSGKVQQSHFEDGNCHKKLNLNNVGLTD